MSVEFVKTMRIFIAALVASTSFMSLGAMPTVAATTVAAAPIATSPAKTDPFLYLEELNGARALKWAKAEDAKTLGALERDPHFPGFLADALKINQATDRIPGPEFVGGRIFNFWQDPEHVRGIWRSTTLADYATPMPTWTTVLDLDALAKSEGKNWVWEGADCTSPSESRCLIALSEGGEDAATHREFDLKTGTFVAGGFVLPRGKQSVAWVDEDTLLASREWTPGELTASGYAYVVKRVKRGEPLANATELFRGTTSDVSVSVSTIRDGDGHRAVEIDRGVSFFESERHLYTGSVTLTLALPKKADIVGLVADRLLIEIRDDWKPGGTAFAKGSLVAVDLAAASADPQHLVPTLVFAPGPRETIEGVATTRDRVIVHSLENVNGRATVYTPVPGGAWTSRPLALPNNSALGLGDTDIHGSQAFITVTSFLVPTTLVIADTATGTVTTVKSTTPKFDASNDVVEQRDATSSDGTKIPYFIVHPKNIVLDGTNPTLLYAYGGFNVSETPRYNGVFGKLWLERGGVYVLANIRGGGEFGPAWHDAGLKTHRQLIYDDFVAVAKDLIATKVTSPRHLGIEGGSNGGLLMGVQFTQHPELWNAVDIQVPLLDMLRFEQIQAGASWVGEYGTVKIPEERAFLAKISPYANLRSGVKYPTPFIWTTTKDDRVGPQHARKFAAKLKSLGDPYYFYEVTEGGHGAGANIKERSLTTALELTYFTKQLR